MWALEQFQSIIYFTFSFHKYNLSEDNRQQLFHITIKIMPARTKRLFLSLDHASRSIHHQMLYFIVKMS